MPPAKHLLSDTDYDTIAAAVMETSRGRWFLAEYARRNRNADTATLMAALQRLEKVVAGHATPPPAGGVRAALAEMARTLERTKSQMAAVMPRSDNTRSELAGYEFDAAMQGQEQATSDILAAAEQVQDLAWTLREEGVAAKHCEFLETRASDIYAACSLQELSAQRTRRMVQALRFLDGRIGTMLAMCGPETAVGSSLADEAPDTPLAVEPMCEIDWGGGAPAESGGDNFTRLASALAASSIGIPPEPESAPTRPQKGRDPLGSLKALTPEERLALFS
jgi:hypothetical protein